MASQLRIAENLDNEILLLKSQVQWFLVIVVGCGLFVDSVGSVYLPLSQHSQDLSAHQAQIATYQSQISALQQQVREVVASGIAIGISSVPSADGSR